MTATTPSLKRPFIIAMMVLIVTGLTGLFKPIGSKTSLELNHHSDTQTNRPTEQIADHWDGIINYAPGYDALDPLIDVTNQNSAQIYRFNATDEYWGLPRAPGYQDVAAYCTACHSIRIVMQQQQTREGWRYLLSWMTEKQGMAPLPDDTYSDVLDYLADNFAPK